VVLVDLLEQHGQDVVDTVELELLVVKDKLDTLVGLVAIGVNRVLKVEIMEALVDNQVEQ
jgi:hypothetical protein